MNAKKRSLLFIDDDPTFRRMLSILLAQENIELVTADNTESGIQLLSKHDFQVAVVDYKLPGNTGIDFFESIKSTYPNIVRILLTAYTSNEVLLDAINRGEVFKHIEKPVHLDLFMSSIEQAFAMNTIMTSKDNMIKVLEDRISDLETRSNLQQSTNNAVKSNPNLHSELLNAMNTPILVLNQEMQFIEANSSALNAIGYEKSDLLNAVCAEVFPKAEFCNDLLQEKTSTKFAIEGKTYKTTLVMHNGTVDQVSLWVKPFKFENENLLLIMLKGR